MARFRAPGVYDSSKYAAGAVVWTLGIPDHHGNTKDRPIVLLAPEENDWVGVAISTVEPDKDELTFCVEMLWAQDGHHKTGMDRKCWAICPWKVKASQNQLRGRMGFVPSSHLKRILALA